MLLTTIGITYSPNVKDSGPEVVMNSCRVFGVHGEDVAHNDDGGMEGLKLHQDHVLDGQVKVADELGEGSSLVADHREDL